MPSFDIVSEVDLHELTNAVDHASREIGNRYDFKGSSASMTLQDQRITLVADSDFQIQQMHPVLYQKLSNRGIDSACLSLGKVETAGKGVRQYIDVRQGIDKETAKKLVATIKSAKLKVQASIQGEQVRVTGKKRDDLQQTIALLKESDNALPLQYQNFRD